MGTVFMDVDAVLFFAIDVAADMIAAFDDEAGFAAFFHFMGEDSAEKAAADDEIVVMHGWYLLWMMYELWLING